MLQWWFMAECQPPERLSHSAKTTTMKERILTGWTLQRLVFLGVGAYLLISAAMSQQWVGAILGAYFASMGLFAFGCAAGGCGTGNFGGNKQQAVDVDPSTIEIEFEEIKSK